METLIINIPKSKSLLIKQLLIELVVEIRKSILVPDNKIPNAVTRKIIKDARKGKGIGEPIQDIKSFLEFL